MLYRLRVNNQRWRTYSRYLINENRWRAQRYGIDKGLVDFGRGDIIDFPELLEEMLSLIGEDAAFFGCEAEVEHARKIIERGTSAHWQLATYKRSLDQTGDAEQAMRDVVDMLIEETLRGV